MTEQVSPTPLEPSEGRLPFAPADPELAAIVSLSFVPRTLVASLMIVVASLVALLGLILLAVNHWAAKAVGMTVVEPLALFTFCCGLYCLVPASPLGRLMARTYCRAKFAIWAVMFACALGTVIGLLMFTIWRMGQ